MRLLVVDLNPQTLKEGEDERSLGTESLLGRCKEEEIVQKSVETEMRKVYVGFYRFGDAVERPWGDG